MCLERIDVRDKMTRDTTGTLVASVINELGLVNSHGKVIRGEREVSTTSQTLVSRCQLEQMIQIIVMCYSCYVCAWWQTNSVRLLVGWTDSINTKQHLENTYNSPQGHLWSD